MQNILTKIKNASAFLTIFIGMLFFANPMLALFDIFPDFIGCVFVMYGAHLLAPVTADFEDTFHRFKYLIFASVGRTLIAFSSAQFDGVTYLSVSLMLAVIELIIAVMAFTSLSEGLATLKIKFGGIEKNPAELRGVGIAFFAARGLCSMLPYISSVLDTDEEFITGESFLEATDYSGVLMLVNIVITVIFAVFFIITLVNHILKPAKNTELVKAIGTAINEKRLISPEYFTRKTLTFALSVLAYSSLFLIDFIAGVTMGGRSFVPDALFGLTVIWTILLMKKHLRGYKKPLISGIVYTIISLVSFIVYNNFLTKHYLTDFDILIFEFTNQYIVAVAFALAETISLIVFAVMLTDYLVPIVTKYSVPEIPVEFVRLGKQTDTYVRRSFYMLKTFEIFLIFIALTGTFTAAALQLFDVGYIDFPYLIVNAIVHIAFYALASTLFLRLKNGVLKRYERPEDII